MKVPLPDGLGLMLLTGDRKKDSGWLGSATLATFPTSGGKSPVEAG